MRQTKLQSWFGTWTNTLIGFAGSWLITMCVIYTIDDKIVVGTLTTILCTVWSLARGYMVRRYFNNRT